MATARQKAAARKNIRKAQQARRTKPTRGRARSRTGTKSQARSKATARRKATTRAKTRTGAATVQRSQTRRKAQPKRRSAAKSRTGRGGFFHIEVQPKSEFTEFRTQDLGAQGGIERVAGKRAGGSWTTQEWLIAKDQAHVEGRTLVGDTADARKVLALLGSRPRRTRTDRFSVHEETGARRQAKPTTAPRRAGLPSVRAPQKGRKRA